MTIKVDDILVNDDGRKAKVIKVTEDTVTLEWEEDGEIKTERLPLNELVEACEEKPVVKKPKKTIKEKKEVVAEAESVAAQTLHPDSKPAGDDPKSKLEYISSMIGAMASMQDHELEKFWNDAVALVGKEADKLPAGATAEHNRSTIEMKPSDAVKGVQAEQIAAIFSGEELSEDFKDKATTLFEAALSSHIRLETVKLEEAYKAKEEELQESYQTLLDESIEEVTDQLTTGLESYLDYVAEQWMTENEVAIESTLRNELMDEFVEGLKNLFAEHYISVPEDKVDVVDEIIKNHEELKQNYNEVVHENVELRAFATDKIKEDLIAGASAGLNPTQTKKFNDLCVGIDFEDAETFTKKLETIKEGFVLNGKKPAESNIITESFEGETVAKVSSPAMASYARALTRTVKN